MKRWKHEDTAALQARMARVERVLARWDAEQRWSRDHPLRESRERAELRAALDDDCPDECIDRSHGPRPAFTPALVRDYLDSLVDAAGSYDLVWAQMRKWLDEQEARK